MRIVIAGAGEVGSHLAKMLSDEDRDIIVIDNDEKKLFALDSYNLKTCLGECTSFKTLQNDGVNNCGLFIDLTKRATYWLAPSPRAWVRKKPWRESTIMSFCDQNIPSFSREWALTR